MASQVIMPKLSPTMEEGVVSRWLKKEGDKATMEMQALANGVLRKILINEGESAPLGQLIAIVGEPDEDISSLLNQAATAAAKTQAPTPAKAEPAAAKVEPASAKPEAEKPAPQASAPQGNGSQAAEV